MTQCVNDPQFIHEFDIIDVYTSLDFVSKEIAYLKPQADQ